MRNQPHATITRMDHIKVVRSRVAAPQNIIIIEDHIRAAPRQAEIRQSITTIVARTLGVALAKHLNS